MIKDFFNSRRPISALAKKPSMIKAIATKAIASVPGGGITITTVVMTTIALILGHLMAVSSIAGIMLSVSLACLYSGSPEEINIFGYKLYLRKNILKVCAKGGWYLDVGVTTVMTVFGFSLGATLGIVAMVCGMYFSMMMSIARWYYNRTNNGISLQAC